MEKHYVYFDGTSAFVGGIEDKTEDTEILFESYLIDECDDFCDYTNEFVI